ncbi:hypothetical protein ANCCEY_14308 [Ancylostoma ceylanicum]|uniref:Piwi domain-containing protein n=1 Tax=Ancylostoma ceylanicum TaxID=53326 RepID=A0A0D6LA45_9BILA|nr:hypothetical protein ANCCEY_14308 [Ancylostoma ceylanicum]
MQSHRPVQGTAKPTSYQLIVDENDMGSDEVQSLMLALCFHHQIVDAPVSIPEPVYQADEWAKRGKDIWKAYTDRHNLLLMPEKGQYADYPIDFEAMTNRLAYWRTTLQTSRDLELIEIQKIRDYCLDMTLMEVHNNIRKKKFKK